MRLLFRKSRVIAAITIGLALTFASPHVLAQDLAPALAAEANLIATGHLKFTPCPENATLDCGTLFVPVDYRKPFGEHVGIAVIRARATNRAKRIGVVVGNPGGPGISGGDFVLNGINVPGFARLRERFDAVRFDSSGR